jgi:hypothetical protein
MKKYLILSLVAVMSLVSFAPALANENGGNRGKSEEAKARAELKKEIRLEIKEERKELKDKFKDLMQALRFAPRALNISGKLVSINSTSTSSTEITVNITKVVPGKPRNMPSSTLYYPQVSTTITLKITDKTHLIRAWGGKMKISEMSVGDDLRLVVKFNIDGSLDLREVKDNSLHVLSHKKGIIDSINTSSMSFVLKQENRTLTVNTDAQTKFKMSESASTTSNASTSFANLQVGAKVKVDGIINTNLNVVNVASVILK